MPPIVIAAGIVAAGTIGSAMYSASEEKKAQKSLLAAQEAKAKELEDKAAAAQTLATEEAKKKLTAKRAAQTQTILTSPLGISESATVSRPVLLGGGV